MSVWSPCICPCTQAHVFEEMQLPVTQIVVEDWLSKTLSRTRQQQSRREEETRLLSCAPWCWPPQARGACQPHLLSMIRAKDLLLLYSQLQTDTKEPQKHKDRQIINFPTFTAGSPSSLISLFFCFFFSPKLPVWAACCCRVSLWGSRAAPWSSHWPFAARWLRAQHPSWHFAVCQCDAVGTLRAAAEKRRSSAGSSSASSSSSTSFSLLSSLVPRAHAVYHLTGGSTWAGASELTSAQKNSKSLFRRYCWGFNRRNFVYAQVQSVIYLTTWMINISHL